MSEELVAVDTSVAVPLVVGTHDAHQQVMQWAVGRRLVLSGHAAMETYAVLTRLPGGSRLAPADAAQVIDESFEGIAVLPAEAAAVVHREFAGVGIAGGAVYDALVACAARDQGLRLVTRDARALATYNAVGVRVETI